MNPATWLDALPAPLAYALVSLVLTAEGVSLAGMFVPGTATVLALGHLSASGAVPPACAVLCAALAALCADSLGFAAGRRAARTGNGVPRRMARAAHRLPGVLSRTPSASVVPAARWFTGPRTLVPRLVGLGPTTYPHFVRWAAPGAVAWSAGLVLAGRWISTATTAIGTGLSHLVSW